MRLPERGNNEIPKLIQPFRVCKTFPSIFSKTRILLIYFFTSHTSAKWPERLEKREEEKKHANQWVKQHSTNGWRNNTLAAIHMLVSSSETFLRITNLNVYLPIQHPHWNYNRHLKVNRTKTELLVIFPFPHKQDTG